ncbi:hypothetical protein BWD08_03310 [Neisseria animaloris]|nr:hypothetical protein BWD08_03310 [Neisseria animaloris]
MVFQNRQQNLLPEEFFQAALKQRKTYLWQRITQGRRKLSGLWLTSTTTCKICLIFSKISNRKAVWISLDESWLKTMASKKIRGG